jgi:RNA polymerase sigma-70 factor (ECF subfamily)
MRDVDGEIERLYRQRYVNYREALAPVVGSREAAHDVVQEAFARALSRSSQLGRRQSLAPWVWKIALRVALEMRKRPTLEQLPDDITIIDQRLDPELAAAVRMLPPQRRVVLFLHYYADLSYTEISEALGIREGTVAATLSQARQALLRELSREEALR